MSIRAELIRLGLRCVTKHGGGRSAAIAIPRLRDRLARFERWTPQPPAGTTLADEPLGDIPALRVAVPRSRPDRHILFLHGGGYLSGTARLYRHVIWRIAAAAHARVTAIDYRLAPEHPFPAALDDAIAAWRALLAEGADWRRTIVMGDSAGGGLALALGLRLRDEGDRLPAALVALSPWTDLALTGPSLRENAVADPMQNAADLPFLAACYLAGADPRHPYASPLYGDPAGLPPTLIQVGSDEILRDDSVRMVARMRAAGVDAVLEIWARMPHVWHLFAAVMPEARRAIARLGEFVQQQTA